MKKYTAEEKKIYHAQLRAQWQAAKALAENGEEAQAIIASHGLKISLTGFVLIQSQMQAQGLDGLPYLDAKTFEGWKEAGFTVKKGEKSTLRGITWICPDDEAEREPGTMGAERAASWSFPKAYHLFHRSQVREL